MILCDQHLSNAEWLARYRDQIDPAVVERIEMCFAEIADIEMWADDEVREAELTRDIADKRCARAEQELADLKETLRTLRESIASSTRG